MVSPSTAGRLPRRERLAIWLTGVGISVAIGLAAVFGLAPITRLDHALFDTWVRSFASGEPRRGTVVIDIDDVSLSAVGQWPWPRYRIAALIQRVAAAQPAAIALDILFPEADRSSLASIQETFKRDFGVDVSFSGVPTGLLDNDGFLGEVIARAGVVGSRYFYFDHVSPGARPGTSLTVGGRTDLLRLTKASGVLVNAPPIATRTATSGFVNTRLDDDNVLRRLPLLIDYEGSVHVNLSLAAVMHAAGETTASIESDRSGLFIRSGRHRIPIDAAGFALLRFEGGPAAYRAIPAVDVLGGAVRDEDLRDRIVFIGTSAVGLNDRHPTALDPAFPGLKIQSVMAENILADHFVGAPRWGSAAVFGSCLLAAAAVCGMFAAGAGIATVVAGAVLVGGLPIGASAVLFERAGLFVSAAPVLLVVATLFVALVVIRFAVEKRRAATWRRQLENARQVTMESMASVAETRDPETGAHIKRTQHYVRAIAEELKRSGHYTDILSHEYIELLFISAPLHDIGKVGVADQILLKPGRLTHNEMEAMKQHAEFGRNVILSTAERIEGDNFLVIAADIAGAHHEKWDGTGYPLGLAGQAIPLAGRIMAVADIYDALISRRVYKEPYSHAVATTLMTEGRDKTFDPAVLDAFFRIEQQVRDIANRYRDEDEVTEAPAEMPAGLSDDRTIANPVVTPAEQQQICS